jgi:ribosomal protein L16/L10AE
VIEALLRAKFKFPVHQKIHILKNWEFEDVVAEKSLF